MGSIEGVGVGEVTRILGVSRSAVDKMTRDGRLRIRGYDGKRVVYDEEEVHALREARERGITHQELQETAQQAWAAARVAQQRCDALERFLGLHLPPTVQLDDDGVRSFHAEVIAAKGRRVTGAEKVNYWADRFLGVCDVYLTRVRELLGVEDPWTPYLALAEHLVLGQDYDSVALDPNEAVAYKRLHAARTQLRYAVFTYLLQRFGKQKAFKVFPTEFRGYNHDIMLYALAARAR